jgi:hypothetical protein
VSHLQEELPMFDARPVTAAMVLTLSTLLGACAEPAGDRVDAAVVEARLADLEDRFTPGLHTLMGELGTRHAMLWFSGDARNWPLADYQLHEVEELVEDIETLHPVYDDIPVAELVGQMLAAPLEALETAVDAGDHAGFVRAFDELTQGCNGCHVASDRAVLRLVRPVSPPVTNLDFQP